MAGAPLGGPALLLATRFQLDPIRTLDVCRQRWGDVFSLPTMLFGRLVVLADPRSAHQILTADPHVVHGGEAAAALLPFMGNSVVTADEEEHAERRRRLLPVFRSEHVTQHSGAIAGIVERHIATWPRDRPFPLLPRLRSMTFAVIARLVMGIDDAQLVDELYRRLSSMLSAPLSVAMWLARSPFQSASASLMSRRQAPVDELLQAEIAHRKLTAQVRDASDALSVLTRLRAAGDLAMTDGDIRDELRALLIAGHETTAVAIAWTIERLVRHPAVLSRLMASVDAGDDAYLQAVIRESLRLRPPVLDAVRMLKQQLDLRGATVPAGTVVMAVPALIHRRPELFSEPEGFRPERFADTSPDPSTWIPFGAGQRRCLGGALAETEMQVVLSVLLRELRFEPADARPERTGLAGTLLFPDRGCLVLAQARHA